MPVVRVLRLVSLRMDEGRLIHNLAPGDHAVTQDAADRLIAGGHAELVKARGQRFADSAASLPSAEVSGAQPQAEGVAAKSRTPEPPSTPAKSRTPEPN